MKKIFFFLLFISIASYAQKGYPTPPETADRLFYIQHSDNHNTFVYDVNFISDKKIDTIEPIKIYRIVYTKGGAKEELTHLQRKVAYGVDFKKIKENHFEFSLVSFPDNKFYLGLDSKGKPQVKTTVNGKKIILKKIYIAMVESKSIKPEIKFINFYGHNQDGNIVITKKF